MKNSIALCLFAFLSGAVLTGSVLTGSVVAEDAVDYQKQVKSVLAERCFACHGALKQEGGLRLDAASLIRRGGDSGAVLVANKSAESLLIERVSATDLDDRMPPEGEPLTREQIQILRTWIDQGAVAPDDEPTPADPRDHWAFQSPKRLAPPATSAAWVRNDIDRFLAAAHQRRGLQAVGEAQRATLLRRVYLDLIGLPPTREQLRAFLEDDSPQAYERVVDDLLASPQYGQRWARHWMDVWRYSDPSGYGKEIRDGRKHIWRWRDWIVDSLNGDKGYDQMIVEMLAADEAAPDDPSVLRATGFLARNWYKFNRNVWLDNIVEHSSKAFLGLTTNCARCHDHKYDPIAQTEYFRLRAIFETHDVRDDPHPEGAAMLVRAYDAHAGAPTYLFLQGDERRPDKDQKMQPGLPSLFGKELEIRPVDLPPLSYYPALRPDSQQAALAKADQEIAIAKRQLATAEGAVAQARQSLAEFKPPAPPSDSGLPKVAPAELGKAIVSDDFSKLDPDRWTVDGGNWTIQDGRLVQDLGETLQHRLLSRMDHPRDFRVRVRLRITGGEMWRSVGLGFDGQGKAMNAVYLSAFGGGKVQATLQNDAGTWAYPQEGAKSHPVVIDQEYHLEILVRDRLMNVKIDDQLLLTFTLPAKRTPGQIAIWTFSAVASFDDFQLATLPQNVKLVGAAPATKPVAPPTKEDLQNAVDGALARTTIARLHADAAKSARDSLAARYAAERIKHGLDSGDWEQKARAASNAERIESIRSAEEMIARDRQQIVELKRKLAAGDTKVRKTLTAAEKSLASHEKQRTTATDKTGDDFAYQKLGPIHPQTSTGRRLAWARWITNRSNPLAARVAVNHIWLRHFDEPLVERMFDFGLRSPQPQHADLLDWLAVRFIDENWSMKRLHKLIVTSGAYRLSSSRKGAAPANQGLDPDNLLLWRQNVRRMEAEAVRDSVLHVGGALDVSQGGPPIDHSQGQTVLRRSIYFRQDKERQMVFLSLFDGAKVNECYRRTATIAPQQALAMYNSKIADSQAGRIAGMEIKDDKLFVVALFERILCRRPNESERKRCIEFLDDLPDPARARRQLALVLLNHNDFLTIR